VIGFIGSSGRTRTYNPSVNSSQKGTATLLLPSVTKCFKTATDAPFLRIRHNTIALPSATETVPCLTDVGHRNGHTVQEADGTIQQCPQPPYSLSCGRNHPRRNGSHLRIPHGSQNRNFLILERRSRYADL